MIVVIDYGMGNLHSVKSALDFLGAPSEFSSSPEKIRSASKLILPGVGSFSRAMANIRARGLEPILRESALSQKKPLLGICLGMQLLAETGEEGETSQGLGLLPGKVVRLPSNPQLKVPHIGFNSTTFTAAGKRLFSGLGDKADFYYVHSFHFDGAAEDSVAARCSYGIPFTAAVSRGNVHGTQFHPEKSQKNGLRVLQAFLESDSW